MTYLVRKTGKARAHLWIGDDTACHMWATGGLKHSHYEISETDGGQEICQMCQHNAHKGHSGERGCDRPTNSSSQTKPYITRARDGFEIRDPDGNIIFNKIATFAEARRIIDTNHAGTP